MRDETSQSATGKQRRRDEGKERREGIRKPFEELRVRDPREAKTYGQQTTGELPAVQLKEIQIEVIPFHQSALLRMVWVGVERRSRITKNG
jgi:hypothetical protein